MTQPGFEPNPDFETKEAWRRWAKKARASPSFLSPQVVAQLRVWPEYRSARNVLSYLAFGSEIDLQVLHGDREKTFYVTRTPKVRSEGLTIHRLDERLEPHPYGYLQPGADAAPVSPHVVDLALVPGLCFDVLGTRLGYGKGYYDRLLPVLRPETPRVGVSAAALVVSRLPRGPFDVPMTHLVTESGVIATTQNPARG